MSVRHIKNATIEAASLSFGDMGLLTSWLTLDYGGTGQGFGGYALYLPKSWDHHTVLSFAGHWIFRCCEVAGVDDWAKIVGRTIRVRCEDDWGRAIAIGHITKDDWFDPTADFAAVQKGRV